MCVCVCVGPRARFVPESINTIMIIALREQLCRVRDVHAYMNANLRPCKSCKCTLCNYPLVYSGLADGQTTSENVCT